MHRLPSPTRASLFVATLTLGAACAKNGDGSHIAGDPAPTTSGEMTTTSATTNGTAAASIPTTAATASMAPGVATTKTKPTTSSFDCPAKKPSDGASCAKLAAACRYPTYVAEGASMDECICSPAGEWHCHADPKAPINSK